MDEKALHYRERASQLQKIADGTPDEATRKALTDNIAEYEKMALALDSVAPANRVHPKHPND